MSTAWMLRRQALKRRSEGATPLCSAWESWSLATRIDCAPLFQSFSVTVAGFGGKLHAFQAVHRHVLRLLAACIVSHQACA